MKKKGVFGTKEWASGTVNITSGCIHDCKYCLDGDTLILMKDLSTKKISEIDIGDEIIGVKKTETFYKLVYSKVLNHWKSEKQAWKIKLSDGREVICSDNHRWLSNRGWKYTYGTLSGKDQRPFLTPKNKIFSIGELINTNFLKDTEDYKMGYISGMVQGDANLKIYTDKRRLDKKSNLSYRFRLALNDIEALERMYKYLSYFKINTNWFKFTDKMKGIRSHRSDTFYSITNFIHSITTEEYARGFLSGIFDAEGSFSQGILRISNSNETIINRIHHSLNLLNFKYYDDEIKNSDVVSVRIIGGLREYIRLFQLINPSIKRKTLINNISLKNNNHPKVISIENLNEKRIMYDITTGSETFIANGLVSHNCYAKTAAIKKGLKTIDNWKEPVNDLPLHIQGTQGTIMYPSQHDIFNSNLKESIVAIKRIIDNGNSVLIVSKPHYQCILDMCDALQEHKDKILFRFTIGSENDEVLKYWEPNAPNFGERLLSLVHAYNRGFNTSISCEPMLDNNIHAVIDKVRPYVTNAIWLGKGNFMLQRMRENGHVAIEDANKVTQLMMWHNDENIMKLYEQYKYDPMIKWKESIKKVVGLEIPTEAGLDI